MRTTCLVVVGLLVGSLAVPTGTRLQAQGASGGEWRNYAADTRATKYSPLDQITLCRSHANHSRPP